FVLIVGFKVLVGCKSFGRESAAGSSWFGLALFDFVFFVVFLGVFDLVLGCLLDLFDVVLKV
ncbi:hypothetical protein AAHH80_35175, partial [Burkholderia pseudomallei]